MIQVHCPSYMIGEADCIEIERMAAGDGVRVKINKCEMFWHFDAQPAKQLRDLLTDHIGPDARQKSSAELVAQLSEARALLRNANDHRDQLARELEAEKKRSEDFANDLAESMAKGADMLVEQLGGKVLP